MRWILMMLAVTLMFAVQAVAPSEIVNAQDEAKPEAKETVEKPAWDDGSGLARVIRHFQGAEKMFEGSELTQADIDLFCKLFKDFGKTIRSHRTPEWAEKTAVEVSNIVNQSDWFKEWCNKHSIQKPERWSPTGLKITIHDFAGSMEEQVRRDLKRAKKTLTNAEATKNTLPEEYVKAQAKVDVLKAQFKAINDLPGLTVEEMKLIATNKDAIEAVTTETTHHEITPEERAIENTRGANLTDTSQVMIDTMSEAIYYVQVHDNPIAGQYWLIQGESHGVKTFNRWQVVKVEGDTAIVENAVCTVDKVMVSHYVLAYEVDMTVEGAAEGVVANVTKAWKGLPGKKGTELAVMEKPETEEAGDETEIEKEDFEGLELAGGTWSGKMWTMEIVGMAYKTWVADNGWFNKQVRTELGGTVLELTAYGDDAKPLLKWE